MKESDALRLVSQARLREQPSIVLELVKVYKSPDNFETAGFWRGYIAALEWVLGLRPREEYTRERRDRHLDQ